MTTQTVNSPCISICALDEKDVCMGCFRTASEITRWSQASDCERRNILEASAQRAAQGNPFV